MFIMIRCGTVHSTLLHMVCFVTEGIGLEEKGGNNITFSPVYNFYFNEKILFYDLINLII